jgi:hypothetical protein
MLSSCRPSRILAVFALLLLGSAVLFLSSAPAEAQLILRETFETDGDGTRYNFVNRGFEINTGQGPGVWGHNFDATKIGLASEAPKKRAAILWEAVANPGDYTDDAFAVFDSLINWATDNKANARVGFFPGPIGQGAVDIRDRLLAAGHTVTDIPDVASLPAANQLDLLIHSNEGAPDPFTAFVSYAVPLIAFNAENHDDSFIIRRHGTVPFVDPVSINVVAENAGHPALGGKTGTIPWTNFGFTMQGLGTEHSGGQVLARVVNPANPATTLPALYVIDEGAPLLGGFSWDPQGDGYVVGADLDHTFGGGVPRQLNIPVNLAGHSDVQLTVALAATDADFEPGDFSTSLADYLAISIDPNGSGTFTLLAEFTGNAAKAFEEVQIENGARVLDGGGQPIFTGNVLSNQAFKDYSVDLPAGTANAVIRFEAASTFINEIIALDDVRVGVATATPGDFDNDGDVDGADLTVWKNQFGPTAGADADNDGDSDGTDFLLWQRNVGAGLPSASAATAVPEPAAWALAAMILSCLWSRRRGFNRA